MRSSKPEKTLLVGENDVNGEEHKASSLASINNEKIMTYIGFGRYQILHLIVVGIACMCDAIELNLIVYINIAAVEELGMGSMEQGLYQSAPFIGMACGLWFGYLADRWSRRNTLHIAITIAFVFSVASSFATTFNTLLALRILTGVGLGPIVPVAVVFTAEYFSQLHRAFPVSFIFCAMMVGQILLAVLALFIVRNLAPSGYEFFSWHGLLLCASIPAILAIIGIFFLEESPTFLLERNRCGDAIKAYLRIYSCNKGIDMDNIEDEVKDYITNLANETGNQVSEIPIQETFIRELLSDVKILINKHKLHLILLSYISLTVHSSLAFFFDWTPLLLMATYNSSRNTSFTSQTSSSPVYFQAFAKLAGFSNILPVITLPIAALAADKVGRRPIFTILNTLVMVTLILIWFGKSSTAWTQIAYGVSLALVVPLLAITQIMVAETFPTLIRSSGTAIVVFNFRLGGILTGIFVGMYFATEPLLIFITILVLSAVNLFIIWLLPETKNKLI